MESSLIETSDFRGWGVPVIALIVALSAVIYAVLRNWISRRRAEAELRRLCHGDAEMLERLVAFENDRTPGQSREEAAQAASYALRRDNR